MKKIILIACAAKKKPYKAKASDLYDSPLFRGNMRYAKCLRPDSIFILSAKHGLLELNREIESYNATLNEMPSYQVKEWANMVIQELKKHANLQKDHFILLAGERYRKYLLPHLTSHEIPMQGMSIGKQLQFLAR
jgi:hypothetical protein